MSSDRVRALAKLRRHFEEQIPSANQSKSYQNLTRHPKAIVSYVFDQQKLQQIIDLRD